MGRAPCCDKANVKKGPWSPEEDAKLKAFIEEHGTGGNWIALPQKIGLKRCGKSCRLRWLNYLRPNIKHGGFSEEEDNIISNLYISIGSRWSVIAAQLPGRTDNDIKNYWNTRLKKKLLGKRKQSNNYNHNNNDGISPNSSSNSTDQDPKECLSNSALERLQLHMQLQGHQNNPLSFYTLWPKLHPMQQKLVQSLQALNNNNQNPNHHFLNYPNQLLNLQPTNPNHQIDTINSVSLPYENIPIHSASGDHQVSNFVQVDGFLNDKGTEGNFNIMTQTDDQLQVGDEFDSNFKDYNLIWGNHDQNMRSASSSNSNWDSTSVLQSEFIFQDFDLGII